MRIYYILILFIPHLVTAQSSLDKGIDFTKELCWKQVLRKAKEENKMIFLDCYTTWCAPCRAMEKQIYPLEKVGEFYNKHFIPVKVQFDKTAKDDDYVKAWYQDATKLEKELSIDAYPTYIFLSPEGKPLHRASGGFSAEKFIALANDALNPETQSYNLASKYDPEKMDTAEMKRVSVLIRRSAPELAGKIALAYLKKLSMQELSENSNIEFMRMFYNNEAIQGFAKALISKFSASEMLSEKNIDLATSFLTTTKDKAFVFFYTNYHKVDSVKNIGKVEYTWFVKNILDDLIFKEDVNPAIVKAKDKNTNPSWSIVSKVIQTKYGKEYADRLLLKAKMSWYSGKKDFENYCKYLVQYMERYGRQLEFDWGYNNNAWSVFQFSNDQSKLERALTWSLQAVRMNPNANWMDTYANILYKLGHKAYAIRWERAALKLDPLNQDIESNLSKMEKGEATWPSK